jgi:Uma2 family endonuclease
MSAISEHLTTEDLLRMPDDGHRYELVRGESRKMPPSGYLHGKVAMRQGWRLAKYVEENDLGVVCAAETGFRLASDPDTVRAADVAFVRRERVEQAGTVAGYWPGAPDLAIDIISPNDTYTEVDEKVADWLDAGARMVVVMNPRNRTIKVHRGQSDITPLKEEDTFDGGDVVPGFRVRVGELFG